MSDPYGLTNAEIDSLKPWVKKTIAKLLGFPEPTVESIAFGCIERRVSKDTMRNQLSSFLETSTPKFLSSLDTKVREIKTARLEGGPVPARGTKRNMMFDDEPSFFQSKRPATERQIPSKTYTPPPDKAATPPPSILPTPQNPAPSNAMDAMRQVELKLQQQEAVRKAQEKAMEIARAASLRSLAQTNPAFAMQLQTNPQFSALLQSTLVHPNQNASALPTATPTTTAPAPAASREEVKPVAVILDSQGRLVDKDGNVLEGKKIPRQRGPRKAGTEDAAATLSQLTTNVVSRQERREKEQMDEAPEDPNNPYFSSKVARKTREFKFVKEGTFAKKADRMRSRAFKAMVEEQMKQSREDPAAEFEYVAGFKDENITPDCEWWDAQILQNSSYDDVTLNPTDPNAPPTLALRNSVVTEFCHHPVLIPPVAERSDPGPQALRLTRKERRKLRTRTRLEREKERQEDVRMGLKEAPKPKVKISNLMRVLGTQAVLDPSKIEASVREEMATRLAAHEKRNQDRKLTPMEKREKVRRKMYEDTTKENHVAVFRVDSLDNPQHRFKIDMNAQQNSLSGCMLICHGFNLVVVEGGPKAIRRYCALMERRIKWNKKVAQQLEAEGIDPEEYEEESDDDEEPKKKNRCITVWTGVVQKPHFKNFRVQSVHTPAQLRNFLEEFHLAHYYDMACAALK